MRRACGNRTRCLLVLLTLLLLTLYLLPNSKALAQEGGLDLSVVPTFFKDQGGQDMIRKHVQYFTSLQSRMPGHSGFLEAARYISDYLNEIGVKPYGNNSDFYEYYTLTSYVDWGVKIVLEDGTELKAYMCQPDFLNTNSYKSPQEGDKVVYVGGASLEDFNGKNITGKFVIMDFNSKWFFRYALMFGAKGVIYTYPGDTAREEASQKIYNNPVSFPKYLLSPKDSQKLVNYVEEKGGEATLWIDSKMTWERLEVPNIIGFIEGSDPELSKEYIVLSAYYDSYSLTPALAPGATESIGPSVLLEIARFLVTNRPNRSVVLLFTSGHFQSLWGAREFVDRHFEEIGGKIKLFISLDLSYGSDQLAIVNRGSTYAYTITQSLNNKYILLINKIFSGKESYLAALRRALNDTAYGAGFYDAIQLTTPPFSRLSLPVRFGLTAYDSEPFTIAAGGGGLTILTVNDLLTYYMTPLDTFDKVNFDNVFRQVYFIAGVSYALSNEPRLPLSAGRAIRFSTEWGFAKLNLIVSTYNFTTDFFDPVTKDKNPDLWKDLIIYYSGTCQGISTGIDCLGAGATGTFSTIVKPDENGVATIKGLKPYTGQNAQTYFFALAVNSTDGTIYMALDSGYRFGAGGRIARGDIAITASNMTGYAPLFECGSIVLQGVLNPRDLTSSLTPTAYNALSHGPLVRGSKWTGSTIFGDYMFFVEVGEPVEIVIYRTEIGTVWSALTNLTDKDIRASGGYKVNKKGETIVIKYGPLACAEGLFSLNDARVSIAMSYGVSNPMILLYHNISKTYLDNALTALQRKQYSKAYGLSYPIWSYEQKAYAETRILIENVIATTALFFLLLLPFAYVFERLIFDYTGLRRVIIVISTTAILTIVLLLFHPSFNLANNLLMILISLGVAFLIMILLTFLYSEASTSTRIVSSKILGVHSAASTAGAVLSTALGLGVQWMRKRPFRSILTLASITIITFALMTFTSLTSVAEPRRISTISNGPVPYSGILIRQKPWTAIPIELWSQLKYELGDRAYVVPRGWYYPPAGGAGRAFIYWNVYPTGEAGRARIYGVLALTPEEQYVSNIDKVIKKGRWFYPGETYSVIISESLASQLFEEFGYTVGPGGEVSQITIWGLNLTVVGLFDGNALHAGGVGGEIGFTSGIVDLDNEALTPMDPVARMEGAAAPPHLLGDEVVIIPFDLALKIFGPNSLQLMSIAIKPFSESDIEPLSRELIYRLDTYVIYGLIKTVSLEGWTIGDVWELTARAWFSFMGAETLIIPLIIAAVSIFNITIGTLYERVRSVSVYVVVGATPSQTAGIFLSESLVYGLLSSVLGYLFGIIGISTMTRLGIYKFTDFFPNFASSFIFVVIILAILIPLMATLYPALKAWQLVTPSLERKWKVPEPVGDYWTVPLPFVATSEGELMGIIAFMKEFLQAFSGTERTGLFAPEEISFSERREGDKVIKRLHSRIRLAPFDLAIIEDFDIEAVSQMKRYNLTLYFTRRSGLTKNWITSNKAFINTVRKQLLLWRTMPPSVREHYIEAGKKLIEMSGKED